MRAWTDDAVASAGWKRTGICSPGLKRYGEWLGVAPGWTCTWPRDGTMTGRCIRKGADPATAARYCGILQGDWGFSTVFRDDVGKILTTRLGADRHG